MVKVKLYGNRFLSVLFVVFLVAGLLFSSVGTVKAAEYDEDGMIGADEVINDDVFLTGDNVVVDGTVNGTLFAFGNTIIINGKVDGDLISSGRFVTITDKAVITGNVFAGGQKVDLDTQIGGSLFAGGSVIRLDEHAAVERNVFAGGYDVSTDEKSLVGMDLYAGAYQVLLAGNVERDVHIGSAALDVNGRIGRNLKAEVASPDDSTPMFTGSPFFYYQSGIDLPKQRDPGLRIAEGAEIQGDITYTSTYRQDDTIKASPQGNIVYQTPLPQEQEQVQEASQTTVVNVPGMGIGMVIKWLTGIFRNFVTLLILGGLVLWLVPGMMQKPADYLKTKPWHSLGYGAASFFGGYLAIFVVTIVLLLVGLFFAIITLGGISKIIFGVGYSALALIGVVFHTLLWYGSKLVLAFLVGDLIMGGIAPKSTYRKVWALLIGVTIVVILRSLPIIGAWLFNPLMAIFGIGAICLYIIGILKPTQPVVVSGEAVTGELPETGTDETTPGETA